MSGDDGSDVEEDVAHMEGELAAALPEIRALLGQLDERLRDVELKTAAAEATRRLPNWVPTLAACAALTGALLALLHAFGKG